MTHDPIFDSSSMRHGEEEDASSDWEGRVTRPSVELLSAALALVAWWFVSAVYLFVRIGGEGVSQLGDSRVAKDPATRQWELVVLIESQLFAQSAVLAAIAILRPDSASFGRSPIRTAVIGYAIILPLWLGLGALSISAARYLQLEVPARTDLLEFLSGDVGGSSWILVAIQVVIVGPLFEEFLFRKFLLDGLREWTGNVRALITSSVLFGLMHFDAGFHAVPPLIFLGLAFGILRMKSGGLLAPILAHSLHNAVMIAWVVIEGSKQGYRFS
ncbi:MAG: CPBP family intramembrane glutamic endopeptidase [Planctomycetota bacterium]